MNLIFATIVMASLAIVIRLRAIQKPATVKKIILPPLFMSTGLLMFLYEPTRLEPIQVFATLLVGILFSLLLIKTSTFEIKKDFIYLKRSKAFIFILVGLLVTRLIVKFAFGDSIKIEVLAGMFFLLAYGMIIPWRIAMYFSFKKVKRRLINSDETTFLAAKG
ncbi:cytochrome c biogenesis protein CcdC [Anaerobacillus sp. CMMVII]|nr:cytochrome c biogenesis protein CcdC [Anaerobacillus sp. CMMVII]MCT8139247.1 cytochrome c biogenesis protein CcdC [Anaerobacillus sp. CMMVII]